MTILLVGTDFSSRSDRALKRAASLARPAQYELLIAHVIDEDDQGRPVEQNLEEARELLRKIEREMEDVEGIRCSTRIRFGSPAEQLNLLAEETGAELIVIGPHRASTLQDRFSGSTANRVLRTARVPLVVANAVPVGSYDRVLLPTDLGEASTRAAKVIRTLPLLQHAETVLLHVFDAAARDMLDRAMVRGEERDEYLQESAAGARAELASFARDVGLEDARAIIREDSGSIAADIIRAAGNERADVIVIPRSEKGAITKAIVGSIVETVMGNSERDVLVVPSVRSSG